MGTPVAPSNVWDRIEHYIKFGGAAAVALVGALAPDLSTPISQVLTVGGALVAGLEVLAHAIGSRGK